MAGQGTLCFSVLVFLYALFEFLLKRIWWNTSEEYTSAGWVSVKQAVVLLLILTVGTVGFLSVTLAAGYCCIAVAWLLFGMSGKKRSQDEFSGRLLERFLLKQVVIGITLYILWRIAMPITVAEWFWDVEHTILEGFGTSADVFLEKFKLILAILTSYMFVIDGGTRIVKGILGKFPNLYKKVIETLNAYNNSSTESEENVGEWIGILERVITLTLVLTGAFTAIAFVLTAKSITRFKMLENNKDFAEYYLLGTSASMLSALGVGMIVRIIFGLP